jgi:hypothetical protein
MQQQQQQQHLNRLASVVDLQCRTPNANGRVLVARLLYPLLQHPP